MRESRIILHPVIQSDMMNSSTPPLIILDAFSLFDKPQKFSDAKLVKHWQLARGGLFLAKAKELKGSVG